jgi:hypothetical protein
MLRPLYADGTIRAEAQALYTRIALPHPDLSAAPPDCQAQNPKDC